MWIIPHVLIVIMIIGNEWFTFSLSRESSNACTLRSINNVPKFLGQIKLLWLLSQCVMFDLTQLSKLGNSSGLKMQGMYQKEDRYLHLSGWQTHHATFVTRKSEQSMECCCLLTSMFSLNLITQIEWLKDTLTIVHNRYVCEHDTLTWFFCL